MHETWDPERLLRDRDTTQRERHSSATRDLLTEPGWGKWEGVADYVDAREVPLPVYVARPEYAACWAAAGIGGAVALVLLGMALRAAGAF